MKSKTAIAALIVVSVIMSSCTTKTEKKTSTIVADQTFKLKMKKGKCCSSNIPSRFPVNSKPGFKQK